jgi:hypothetical protein
VVIRVYSLFTTELQEFIVGPALHDTTLADEVNLIALLDRAESMGDGDGRSALGSSVESVLNNTLTVTVEGGSSFVEQQNRRVPEQGTGNGDSFCEGCQQEYHLGK